MKKIFVGLLVLLITKYTLVSAQEKPEYISGIYPHLAFFNEEGECGTGAVVPWAGKLWVITYGPHRPFGSTDKLYTISPDYEQKIHPESIGGTPANRMIHRESEQLFIGPYAVDKQGHVRAIPYNKMPGRHTGNARHLTDADGKIYYATMEEGFYEVDVNSLQVNTLFKDPNVQLKDRISIPNQELLPGAHGKGLYSGQGVLVFSNNGETGDEALEKFDIEAGVLAEWDGTAWTVVRRNQFTEVTGPGGIYGNADPAKDPIWATGWDYKSLLLGVRNAEKGWKFYRLPKASYTYDGAHGWNTEWPRIRNVGDKHKPEYLMTMHGMFWKFPASFNIGSSAGIRPLSAYLKVIGDFTRWNDQLVFGTDDAAQKEFLNKRKIKGDVGGPGQSNSNLWFLNDDQLDAFGPTHASGYVWLNEDIDAAVPSDPYLFSGWTTRSAWLVNEGENDVRYTFEIDPAGDDQWHKLKTVTIQPGESKLIPFDEQDDGEWIRIIADKKTRGSAVFTYASDDDRTVEAEPIFQAMAGIDDETTTGGIVYGLGDNRKNLALLANSEKGERGYYEMDGDLNIIPKKDPEMASYLREQVAIPEQMVQVEESSVLIIDDAGRRWRLPLGSLSYNEPTENGSLRLCREVATERDLFNMHGTFYELPAENAGGYAKVRPISSHSMKINDYASYRGLLVMTGVDMAKAENNPHIYTSADKKAAVWVGAIDDLWKLGKPVGSGGPLYRTAVEAGQASDPYLIGFYDDRRMVLSHQSDEDVTFTVEVDPTGDGKWMKYKDVNVKAGETFQYEFPDEFLARWVRIISNKETVATAWFEYR